MNFSRILSIMRNNSAMSCIAKRSVSHTPGEDQLNYWRKIIGNREIVGFGLNGTPSYSDLPYSPMPAIRYMEPTSEIMALHEKEKGDWRLLTKEEKKKLYRASFCQTFAEFQAPTHEWMSIVGYTLMWCSLGVWLYMLMVYTAYAPLPASFSEESRNEQLKRMIHIQVNPITGLTSNWDYDKMDWKVKRWDTPPNPFHQNFEKCKEDD